MRILICFLFFVPTLVSGQAKRFITQGRIEYERTVNMYVIIAKNTHKDNEIYRTKAFEDYKSSNPQFKKLKGTLTFLNAESVYEPESNIDKIDQFDRDPMASQHNITYSNMKSKSFITQKDVYGSTFLIRDSLRSIKWKITDERRDIAGFQCRRANGLTKDSVYVVAFYCEQIHVSSGPESFYGLPGMILGVALPHENVTWFATKVIEEPVGAGMINPPVKGEPITYRALVSKLTSSLSKLGSLAPAALRDFKL
ncbi:GLPGLI family protein [Mucilaginibacter lappiensis]|jgi:GLPGLI family protein|uniref:GLPGLI family protein n=1 Tax=Mucilaginibacter lappiensis TaxID=354630 RepID=UPI003D1A348E